MVELRLREYIGFGGYKESALIGPGVRKEPKFAGGLEGRGFNDNRSPGKQTWLLDLLVDIPI